MAYTQATAADLKAKFPRFDAVADATVESYLTDARRRVDASWTEDDRATGEMLLAAHYMTLEGLGSGTEAEIAAAGLGDFKSVRSGQFSFTRGEGSDMAAAGTMKSTSYGRRWLDLAQINRGGPRVGATGTVPDYPPYPDPYYSSGG